MNSKRRIKVTIDGNDYTIIGKQTPEHIEAVVEMVNNQLNQLSQLDPRLPKNDKALLMAVNAISDQIIKEKKIIELEKEITRLSHLNGVNQIPEVKKQTSEASVPYNRYTAKNKGR